MRAELSCDKRTDPVGRTAGLASLGRVSLLTSDRNPHSDARTASVTAWNWFPPQERPQ